MALAFNLETPKLLLCIAASLRLLPSRRICCVSFCIKINAPVLGRRSLQGRSKPGSPPLLPLCNPVDWVAPQTVPNSTQLWKKTTSTLLRWPLSHGVGLIARVNLRPLQKPTHACAQVGCGCLVGLSGPDGLCTELRDSEHNTSQVPSQVCRDLGW